MTNFFLKIGQVFDEFSKQISSKFVRIRQNSSKFVNVRQNFVKFRQDFVKIENSSKIRHKIGFYSDEQQHLQKKETMFLRKFEFRVVQRNAQRVDFEKC